MITILSPNETHRATLTDHDDGVWVAIRRVSAGPRRPGTQLHAEVIDAPFHVVADRMVDLLAELENICERS